VPSFLSIIFVTQSLKMSSIVRIETAARYSEAVVHNGTVYLAGQVPENTGGGQGALQQATDVLQIIDAKLAAANSSKLSILSATIYLTDLQRDYADMNTAWEAWMPKGAAPARTTVGVTALANTSWVIEITIVAAVEK
jgi:enamine deaminase RidA (YjgF/YER057c/UK114 family)